MQILEDPKYIPFQLGSFNQLQIHSSTLSKLLSLFTSEAKPFQA